MWFVHQGKSDIFYENLFFDIIKDENIKLSADLVATNDYSGNNMLFNAVFSENNQVFDYLVHLNRNFEIENEGLSLIHWAVIYGNEHICWVLLDNNAKVDNSTYKLAKKTFKKHPELLDNFANALDE